ncbi:MAG: hypothetical protein P0116_12705 [Candidatus Nitrosocosmicus sp.]|nr:hypothetical protein [Candidatus Nitrosocosmicus sp.]
MSPSELPAAKAGILRRVKNVLYLASPIATPPRILSPSSFSIPVFIRISCPNYVLSWNTPFGLSEHPHEFAATYGAYKDPEIVGSEQVKYLQHWLIDEFGVWNTHIVLILSYVDTL